MDTPSSLNGVAALSTCTTSWDGRNKCGSEAGNYAFVDVDRVGSLDLSCDSQGTPPRENTNSNQIYHETEAKSRRHTVVFTEAPERTVVRDTRPALIAADDQAEVVVEGHA